MKAVYEKHKNEHFQCFSAPNWVQRPTQSKLQWCYNSQSSLEKNIILMLKHCLFIMGFVLQIDWIEDIFLA